MLVGVVLVDGSLKVVAGCGGAENHRTCIHFVSVLQGGDCFGGFAQTDKQEAGSQGIQRSRMAYLDFSKAGIFVCRRAIFGALAVGVAHYGLDFVDGLE